MSETFDKITEIPAPTEWCDWVRSRVLGGQRIEGDELDRFMTLALGDSRLPKPGETWEHFKGGRYKIIGVFVDNETFAVVIGYSPLDHPNYFWVRTAYCWLEEVRTYLDVGGESREMVVPRFTRVTTRH
jgi:hypothetical protein